MRSWKLFGSCLAFAMALALLVTCSARPDGGPERAPSDPAPLADSATRARDHVLGSVGAFAPGIVAPAAGRDGGTMARYTKRPANPFVLARETPLSTFSADVDTASYANVRRFLESGQLPPEGAVRIEEMLNSFRYRYAAPTPTSAMPFAVTTEVAACPWNPGHRLVLLGLRGRSLEEDRVPPRNLTFLLDVSGSMAPRNRLPLVQQAMKLLVRQLRPQDHVAIVVYAGASGLVLPPTAGTEQGRILAAIDTLEAGGSTNGAAGIRLAYDVTRRHFDREGINRVILATDGDFNVGTTSEAELVALVETERKSGVYLTVLGVGDDNLNDSAMKALSTHGNGNYAYLDRVSEANKVLVREAGGTLVAIAKDVKLQVEFDPRRVQRYRLIGYENRVLANADFADDTKDAGEIGAGHTVTALYEVEPVAGTYGDDLLTLNLRWKEPDQDRSELASVRVRDEGATTPGENLRLASALAAFGMVLSGSPARGSADLALVLELLRGRHGDRAEEVVELIRLVERASELTARKPRAAETSGTR